MKKRKIGFFALLICLLLSLPVSAAETKKRGLAESLKWRRLLL